MTVKKNKLELSFTNYRHSVIIDRKWLFIALY